MSESLIHKQADLQGLSTAILLPSADLFGASARKAVGPLTQVVGIGLFPRTVLTLQRAGIRQLIVLAGPEEDQLKQAMGKGPRVRMSNTWSQFIPRSLQLRVAQVPPICGGRTQ